MDKLCYAIINPVDVNSKNQSLMNGSVKIVIMNLEEQYNVQVKEWIVRVCRVSYVGSFSKSISDVNFMTKRHLRN